MKKFFRLVLAFLVALSLTYVPPHTRSAPGTKTSTTTTATEKKAKKEKEPKSTPAYVPAR